MNRATRWFLRTVVVVGMGLFLSLWWLSFAHGIDFVEGWREGDRYYVGEGDQRLEVAPWLYWYQQTISPWIFLYWLSAAAAGAVLHLADRDTPFFNYVRGIIGGAMAGVLLALAIGQVRHGASLTGHFVLLIGCLSVGLVLARVQNRSSGDRGE